MITARTIRMAAKRFKVHIGYTANGRDRWKRYATLDEAQEVCNRVFAETKIVLCIVEDKPKPRKPRG
jgi:hypothetical protein